MIPKLKETWHMERGIPVAIIMAIVTQLVVATWMVSKYDSHLLDHDTRINTIERQILANHSATIANNERLARIENNLEWLVAAAKATKK